MTRRNGRREMNSGKFELNRLMKRNFVPMNKLKETGLLALDFLFETN